jgi:ribosomal protein S12
VVRLLAVREAIALLPKQSCSHEGIEERSDLLAADVERVSDLCGTERAIAQGGEDIKLHSREHRERGKYRHP